MLTVFIFYSKGQDLTHQLLSIVTVENADTSNLLTETIDTVSPYKRIQNKTSYKPNNSI